MTSQEYIAHVRESDDEFEFHSLASHLRDTARLAGELAQPFGNADWAHLAGLWHDLGKHQPGFQSYIRNASGCDENAHIETTIGRVDHSTPGAIHAEKRLGLRGRVLAYLIAGHHAGLPDWQGEGGRANLIQRLQKTELLEKTLAQPVPEEIRNAPVPASRPPKGADAALWIRMLFSCLVDADFLDTEAFMNPERAAQRGRYPELGNLLEHFETHMRRLQEKGADTPINRLRADILRHCEQAAAKAPGLFSLTVPTGGGKTLSSMAFALRHALAHDKRRILYVIPYTSIIEQTAEVFRNIFGDGVLEHHSNLDSTRENVRSRLACENWDAPIIVTTSVQFFESLFAVRTSRTRKLHNMVNSVVVLDETQLLPPDFLKPILHVIRELANTYGVSFVLCTATQPALESRKGFDWTFDGLDQIQEIMPDKKKLHHAFRRVRVALPDDLIQGREWEDLAEELQAHESALCIVDRRDDCRTLHRLMPPDTLHLSGLMCGQHRSQKISEIRQRLQNHQPTRVISTQLVEAGVDVDFPVVYRALAGLDSIAQAAGRCNREGRLEAGNVVVFVSPRPAPRGHLRQAEGVTRQMLQQGLDDPLGILE